jgi:hypothetical protein
MPHDLIGPSTEHIAGNRVTDMDTAECRVVGGQPIRRAPQLRTQSFEVQRRFVQWAFGAVVELFRVPDRDRCC